MVNYLVNKQQFSTAMSDPTTKALIRLCNSVPGGYKAVADKIQAHPMTLYQVVRGIKYSSGRVRTLGSDVKERLTKAYPLWDHFPDKGEIAAATLIPDLAKILMKVPDNKRPEMERLLASLARAPDSSILLRDLVKVLAAYERRK